MKVWTDQDSLGMNREWHDVTEAADVTEQVLEMARDVIDGWYSDGPIDWENVWDRMEGISSDGRWYLSWGNDNDTPAMRKIQRVIRKERREG